MQVYLYVRKRSMRPPFRPRPSPPAGYGHIAPKTDWGKVITIFYAIPGVPLMMLCLANIGDGMAHSFRFLYWKVCCYACTKKPKKKRRARSMRGSRR